MNNERFTIEGHDQAKESSGDSKALKFNLERIRSEYEAEIKEKNNKQKADIIALKEKIKICRDNIITFKQNIDKNKKEINEIGHNDETIENNAKKRNSRIPFFVAILIFIPLTIFLWLFYSNAVHSLYVGDISQQNSSPNSRNVDNQNLEQGVSLINPNLFNEVFAKGWTFDSGSIFLIVFLSPSIFLGAGFLVFYFKNLGSKYWYIWLILVYIFTFSFDWVIAHDLIEKVEIYTLNQSGKEAANMLNTKIQFAKILFTSFAVYLMWGIIFDYIIHNHKILHIEKSKISSREKLIISFNHEIEKLQQSIGICEKKIESLKKQIPMDFVELEHRLHQFTNGWFTYINKPKMSEEHYQPLTDLLKNITESGKYYIIEDDAKTNGNKENK